jgi:trehalose 6-phosphate synthase/phosphatase
LLFQTISKEEALLLLGNADLALITTTRDSINLTSYEYIQAQEFSKKYNPLIVSEFCGNSGTLSTAFLINPWDPRGVAAAIYDALNLSESEKKLRHSVLHDNVSKLSICNWREIFLQELETFHSKQQGLHKINYLPFEEIKRSYHSSQDERVFFLDYDVIIISRITTV